MQNIYTLNERKNKKSTRLIAIIMGVIMLGLGIYITSIYGIICGTLILTTGFFRKTTFVNEEGIFITYDARIYKYHELWSFTDITEVHMENGYDSSKKRLHFTKGSMSKMLVFNSLDANKVIDIAIKQNPKIHLDEAVYSS